MRTRITHWEPRTERMEQHALCSYGLCVRPSFMHGHCWLHYMTGFWWEAPACEPMGIRTPRRTEPTLGEKVVVWFALTALSWTAVYLLAHALIWAWKWFV